MVGRQLLHYQLTKRLGSGGQATAYLAKDTKLARAVVLKLLDIVQEAPLAPARIGIIYVKSLAIGEGDPGTLALSSEFDDTADAANESD